MNIYSLASLIASIFCVVLGSFVYLNRGRNESRKRFAFASVLTGLWALFPFVMSMLSSERVALLVAQVIYVPAVFTPTAWLHFTFTVVEAKQTIRQRHILILSYGISIFFLLWSFNPLFIKGVNRFAPHFSIIPGPIFFLFMFAFCIIFSCIIGTIFQGFQIAQGIAKNRLRYVLLSFMFGFFSGILHFGAACLNMELIPHDLLLIVFTGLICYSIVRHRLMDIEVIIKKTLVFTGLFAVSYGVIVAFAYFGSVVFENVIQNRWIAMVPSVFVIVLILRPLESFLRNVTDTKLFQKKYDYRKLLKTFTDEVLSVLELKKLINLTVTVLTQIMKLENAVILIRNERSKKFHIAEMVDLAVDSDYATDSSEKMTVLLEGRYDYILRGDSSRAKALPVEIEKTMDKLRSELILPLKHREELIGIVSLGKKKSDEDFTEDDIDMLLTLARTLSIAITNAQLFVQLSEAQAQDAQREKMAVIGTLSAGINHEICNPLGIARGQCEMFLLNCADGVYRDRTHEELLQKACEIMRKVIHETDRATVITRKLSSFAKPAKGEIEDNVRIEDEIKQVISLVEHDLLLENIAIKTKYQKRLPCISADRKQVQEIFFNIIRNAVQSIKDRGNVTISVTSSEKNVFVIVKDTGVGIGKEHLGQIFNPFFTTKDPGKGTGLGLFIVKHIIEKNNGTIEVQSEQGKGTIFTLTFKAVRKRGKRREGDSRFCGNDKGGGEKDKQLEHDEDSSITTGGIERKGE
ncbi:MAG: ATP-binding protein [Candidatus Omnitrophota bacterium]